MNTLTHEQLVEQTARAQWAVISDDANSWDTLGQDEKDEQFARVRAVISTIAEATKERGELARVKSNANHIARMDPLTTLALIARIRELEAKSAADLADYETSLETMTAAP